MSLKMMEEFRLRLEEIEKMQSKLIASVDILDIRTKGGLGNQIPIADSNGVIQRAREPLLSG
jgi:hypothetical protein